MEEKLLQAAALLPEPGNLTLPVENTVKKSAIQHSGRKRVLLLAMVLCLLVTACAYSSTKYGLWGGYSSNSFSEAKAMAAKFDLEIPTSMNGSPFAYVSTAHGAPEGYTHLQALLAPTYKLYSIRYETEKEETLPDGSTRGWTENAVNISFGTTENEQWRYHFSVAEDGSKNYERVEQDSQRTEAYADMTLHLYTIGESHSVMWVDPQRNLIIDLTGYDLKSQEDILQIAKELIDLNFTEEETVPQSS